MTKKKSKTKKEALYKINKPNKRLKKNPLFKWLKDCGVFEEVSK